ANAGRFGFVERCSWEAWHRGDDRAPAPCSDAGRGVRGQGQDAGPTAGAALPSFVPARFRDPLVDSAAKWNVSAALLAAQLMAESNFNPFAVSVAGAQGIAQFMPGTAASYGLADPFDPVEAIDAQAHLMSDLMGQFGSPELALAAYNAGPAPVEACHCVPAIPETSAYVARITALLAGAGALGAPAFEVRLVA
ncbi:MAG: lytic transglycosylase domain-containing protein, partial [Actinobacteria bacterium]|nr:lytic transglycosylase domain-containing protein [Actinomycetota bacterium]